MKPSARKEQIMRCSARVFADKGYYKASVSDIIKEAGIARGTFYLYFAGKREVFSTLIDALTLKLEGCIKRVDLSPGKPPWESQVRSNVSRIVSILLEDRDITLILYNHSMGLDEEYDTKIREFYSRMSGVIKGALVLGREMGLLRSDVDPHLAALQMLGSIKEVIYNIASYGESGFDLDTLVDEMLKYHLGALKTV